MSGTINQITTIPKSSNKTTVHDQLSSLYDNLRYLQNSAFMRGEAGSSIKNKTLMVFENDTLTKFGRELLKCIYKTLTGATLIDEDSNTLLKKFEALGTQNNKPQFYWSYFISQLRKLAVNVYVVENDNGDDVVMTSPYFFIIDERLNFINTFDESRYAFNDVSGFYHINKNVDEDSFSVQYENVFPQLYWNASMKSFCWRINGNNSNIVAQGVAGRDGQNASLKSVYAMKLTVPTDSASLDSNEEIWAFENAKNSNASNDYYVVAIQSSDATDEADALVRYPNLKNVNISVGDSVIIYTMNATDVDKNGGKTSASNFKNESSLADIMFGVVSAIDFPFVKLKCDVNQSFKKLIVAGELADMLKKAEYVTVADNVVVEGDNPMQNVFILKDTASESNDGHLLVPVTNQSGAHSLHFVKMPYGQINKQYQVAGSKVNGRLSNKMDDANVIESPGNDDNPYNSIVFENYETIHYKDIHALKNVNVKQNLTVGQGIKLQTICIECDNDGKNYEDRISEINTYTTPLYLQYSSSANLILMNGGGNVGIGTSFPKQKLHVNGNVIASTSDKSDRYFEAQNSNGKIELLASTYRGVYDSTKKSWMIATNGTNTWMSQGNVGIGIDNPTYKLHVNGNTYLNGTLGISSNALVTNLNADMLDGYHASNINTAGWISCWIHDGSGSQVWVKIAQCQQTEPDKLDTNEAIIEMYANSDQNYGGFTHAYLCIQGYGSYSRTITLTSTPNKSHTYNFNNYKECNSKIYACIDSYGGVWIKSESQYTHQFKFRIIQQGAKIVIYTSDFATSTNPCNVYITSNGTQRMGDTQTYPLEMNGVNVVGALSGNATTATTLQTGRKLWGNNFDGSANINGDIIHGKTDFKIANVTNDYWTDGNKNTHPWYGYHYKHGTETVPNGVYNTTISDYFGMTLKTKSGQLSITEGGNVGIRIANPNYTLHMDGNAVASTSDGTNRYFEAQNSNGKIALLTSTNRGVHDSTTNKWLIATNGTNTWMPQGNVGIGTDAPTYKLQVHGPIRGIGAGSIIDGLDVNSNHITRINELSFTGVKTNFNFVKSGDTNVSRVASFGYDESGQFAQFGTNSTTGNTRVNVLNNKGENRLLVGSSGAAYLSTAWEDDSKWSNNNVYLMNNNGGFTILATTKARNNSVANRTIYFRPDGLTADSSEVSLNTNGLNIKKNLYVNGTAQIDSTLKVKGTLKAEQNIEVKTNKQDDRSVIVQNAGLQLRLYVHGETNLQNTSCGLYVKNIVNEKEVPEHEGYLIKYDRYDYRVLFEKPTAFYNAVDMKQGLTVDGTIICKELKQSSDRRLKSDIKPLQYRGALEPKEYIMNGEKRIGFIAQDVQKLYPELVFGHETENEYLSLDYSSITAILSAENNIMKNEISELKNEINELKQCIHKLMNN